ncbi:MAG: OmpH family outer membrane protein [Pyrinomonadaceae bacterium]|nr:OmpH family outer membrane protein [Pyrinomonadaceae bacterium]
MRFKIVFFIIFSSVFVSQITAQESAKQTIPNILVVDKFNFENEKIGVKKLITSLDMLTNEFYASNCFPTPNQTKINEYKKLIDSIVPTNTIGGTESTVEYFRQQILQLQKEDFEMQKKINENFQKRFELLISPINNEINNLVTEIGKQNNAVILDAERLDLKSQVLAFDDKIEISGKLIPLLNEFLETTKKPDLSLDLPKSKVVKVDLAVIGHKIPNTQPFKVYLEQSRKNQMEKGAFISNEKYIAILKANNIEYKTINTLFDSFKAFAKKNGYSMILDSSIELPIEIQNIQLEDVTNDFISYYNQLNQ